jgi:hypothetical protein
MRQRVLRLALAAVVTAGAGIFAMPEKSEANIYCGNLLAIYHGNGQVDCVQDTCMGDFCCKYTCG